MTELTFYDSLRIRSLHWVARAALRLAPPLRAVQIVTRVGHISPVLRDLENARAAQRVLSSSGSCLSRAVTIASRLPGAEVVIGADPWHSSAERARAHAWVELAGERLEPAEGRQFLFGEMARLRPREDRALSG